MFSAYIYMYMYMCMYACNYMYILSKPYVALHSTKLLKALSYMYVIRAISAFSQPSGACIHAHVHVATRNITCEATCATRRSREIKWSPDVIATLSEPM